MLLFVLAALTIFHFALPRGAGHTAALGLLWIALIFTALLGLTRAFVPEREQGVMDALVLAPCDRSAIWLAKSIAVFAFLGVAELVALPAFSLFFSGDRRAHGRRGRARERRHLRGRDADGRDGGREPRPRADPAAPLPPARDPGRRRRRRRERGRRRPLPRSSSCSTTPFSGCSPGRRSSTSSPRPDRPRGGPVYDDRGACDPRPEPAARIRGRDDRPLRRRDLADLLLRAERRRPGLLAADLLLPRPDRPDRVRVLRLGRVEGAPAPLEGPRERRPRELRRDPPGRRLRLADAADRLDLGEDLVGRLVGLERRPARALPRAVPLLLRLLHAPLLGRSGPGAGEHVARSTRSSASC